jgi:hypothetical protein
VLEAPEPFPGYWEYYSERPHFSAPLYVYLVIQKTTTLEEIVRATQIARTVFPETFEAAYAEIKFIGETFHAIRVRKLDSFEGIPQLQEVYSKIGIAFQKRHKEFNEGALIVIKKLFHLKPLTDDLFLDKHELDHGYFVLPLHARWDEFKELVTRVKYNWNTAKSDFALGFFYTNDRIVDVVRVYNPEISLDLLTEARRQFLNRI